MRSGPKAHSFGIAAFALVACSYPAETHSLTEALLSNVEYREPGPTRQRGGFVEQPLTILRDEWWMDRR